MEEWDDGIQPTYNGYVSLDSKQREFLMMLINHHKGLGHRLFINRVLLNGRYHITKDSRELNRIRQKFIDLVKGNETLVEKYGKPVTDENISN